MLAAGTRIDRYEVVGVLGEGGIATVYHVTHADLGTEHALKLLKHRSGAIGRRMLQEGRIQARLRHPNIVGVTDVVRHDGGVGLVMDYVDGVSLAMLAYNYQLSPEQLDQLAHELFDAVEAAHQLGLVHRDLKPDNVMMAVEGERLVAKVMDFGLAKAMRDELRVGRATRAGQMMGTPQFMAPEQYRDAAAVDARADLYSLAAVLYELMAGEPLFPDEDDLPVVMAKCMTGDWVPLAERAPEARPEWVEAVESCLAVDPAERPSDVAAVRERWGPRPPRAPVWEPAHLEFVRELQSIPPQLDSGIAGSASGPQTAVPNVPRSSQVPVGSPTPTTSDPYAELPRAETVASGEAPDAPPSRTSRAGLGVAFLGLTGVGLGVAIGLLVLGALGLWWLVQPGPEMADAGADELEQPDPPARPEPPTPAPIRGDEERVEQAAAAPVPTPAPAAVTPAPAAPTPAEPAPAPEPEVPEPEVPEPEVVQVPSPQPVPVEVPATAGSDTTDDGPDEAVRDPSLAQVALPGDFDGYLVDAGSGQRVPLDAAPPGTYDLYVFFDTQVPTLTASVTLNPGQTRRFTRCDSVGKLCK